MYLNICIVYDSVLYFMNIIGSENYIMNYMCENLISDGLVMIICMYLEIIIVFILFSFFLFLEIN